MGVFSYTTLLFFGLLSFFTSNTQALEIESFTIYSKKLNTEKTIWVLLPEGSENPGQKFPVLYMHDAQNLFDATHSYAGEWEVDETMEAMKIPCIVVGVEHGNEKRIDELTPYEHEKYGGGMGSAYSHFIVNTLKPKIDSLYPTLPGREHTLVGGSSLGGLMSHYMLFTYPEVFSKGIIFSPSYWYSEEIFDLTKKAKATPETMIYMATGALEPDSMVPDHQHMAELFSTIGMEESALKTIIRKEADHNEEFWKKEFTAAMSWYKENYFDKK